MSRAMNGNEASNPDLTEPCQSSLGQESPKLSCTKSLELKRGQDISSLLSGQRASPALHWSHPWPTQPQPVTQSGTGSLPCKGRDKTPSSKRSLLTNVAKGPKTSTQKGPNTKPAISTRLQVCWSQHNQNYYLPRVPSTYETALSFRDSVYPLVRRISTSQTGQSQIILGPHSRPHRASREVVHETPCP